MKVFTGVPAALKSSLTVKYLRNKPRMCAINVIAAEGILVRGAHLRLVIRTAEIDDQACVLHSLRSPLGTVKFGTSKSAEIPQLSRNVVEYAPQPVFQRSECHNWPLDPPSAYHNNNYQQRANDQTDVRLAGRLNTELCIRRT